MSDAIQEAIDTLTELKRLHQLNFELIEELNTASQWILDNNINVPNKERIRSLLGKSLALLKEIQSEPTTEILVVKKLTDGFLQRNPNDKDFTESS